MGHVARSLTLPIGVGLVVGITGASLLTRSIESFLFGVSPMDAQTYITVTGVLVLVAMVATLVPARRATTVHPVEVLKAE